MKNQKNGKSLLSVLLAVIMVFTVIAPIAVFAASVDESKLKEGTFLTSKTEYAVAPGVTEARITTNDSTGVNQVTAYVLEIDMTNPDTSIIASYKDYDGNNYGFARVRDQAYSAEAKRGVDVVAGVNADFFNMHTGETQGALVMNGTVYHAADGRPYFGITASGEAVISTGKLTDDIVEAVGGLCLLVQNGKVTQDAYTNGYGAVLNPRTAVGIKADGTVLMYVSDGRQPPYSVGQYFTDLAHSLVALGCETALCLDGGGSATFVSQREGSGDLVCRNKPSDQVEREVTSSLLVCSSAEPSDPPVDDPNVGEHCHDYAFDGKNLTCGICDHTEPVGTYTGFATNATSGKNMYILHGKVMTGWFVLDTADYLFDENGEAMSGTVAYKGFTYECDENGKLKMGALVQNNDKTYSYYINGESLEGWFWLNDGWYYFRRADHKTYIGSLYVYKDEHSPGMLYKFGADSKLVRGAFVETTDGTSYYWGPEVKTGLTTIDGKLYYFSTENTYMLKNDSVEVDGTVYAFGANGVFVHYGAHIDEDGDEEGLCDICSPKPVRDLGDVDGDYKVSSADARLALRFSVKLETLTEKQQLFADVDKSGAVDSSDARLILRAAVGLEDLKEWMK
ncbi:MAG: phosphodiester glycosidase family protein [Clostridia bacterium]|nr:phosphodiester glycosidase family protein [Clostridia bacterium]